MMVSDTTGAEGSLGDPNLDAAAIRLAEDVLAGGGVSEGMHSVKLPNGAGARLFLEVHRPNPEMIIVGAGHIAQPLAQVGALLGFSVSVLDDRPDFATRERFPSADRVVRVDFSHPFRDTPVGRSSHVVLVTRGHKYDYECLRHLLVVDPGPAYIGMIGSRRRVRATFFQLKDDGVDPDRLAEIRAPVGLDLRAETPAEIAVAVAAEMVLTWRGGTGEPLSSRERILERFFSE
jgi:xanthine dehydrogenase accessory factor